MPPQKSFISVRWLYLISFLIYKQTGIYVQIGEEEEDQVIVSLAFREYQKKETSSERLDLVSESIINTCPNMRSACIFISLQNM